MTLELTSGQLISVEIAIAADMRNYWKLTMLAGEPKYFARDIDELADVRLKIENYWSKL